MSLIQHGSNPPLGVFDDGINGQSPRGLFWGTTAPDGTTDPWLEAAIGSVYMRKLASNVALYVKRASAGANADWAIVPMSTALLTQTEVDILDGATVTTAELNILDGVTSTAAELNILDGVTSTAAELNILDGVTATAAELNNAADVSARVQELTATGTVTAGMQSVELNHASIIIAATIADASNHQGLFVVKDTSASGTAAHTLTLTAGTFNGTNNVATLNARDEALFVYFDSAGRGQVIANIGTVALS